MARAALLCAFLVGGVARAAPADPRACDAFVVQMHKYKIQYDALSDGRAATAVFNLARAFEREFFARYDRAIFCRGTVALREAGDADEVKLGVAVGGDDFHLLFQQGKSFDAGIAKASEPHRTALDLREGDCVTFGGVIGDPDHPEKSATEPGAMGEPEYALRFLKLAPCAGGPIRRASLAGDLIRRALIAISRR